MGERGEPAHPVDGDATFRQRLHALFDNAGTPAAVADADLAGETVTRLAIAAESGLAPTGGRVPWQLVPAETRRQRDQVIRNFEICNADALARRDGSDGSVRAQLDALRRAPAQRSVFATTTPRGTAGVDASVGAAAAVPAAAALAQLRLAARAAGLIAVWITALDADAMRHALDVPGAGPFVGHLCLGHPASQHTRTETNDPDA